MALPPVPLLHALSRALSGRRPTPPEVVLKNVWDLLSDATVIIEHVKVGADSHTLAEAQALEDAIRAVRPGDDAAAFEALAAAPVDGVVAALLGVRRQGAALSEMAVGMHANIACIDLVVWAGAMACLASFGQRALRQEQAYASQQHLTAQQAMDAMMAELQGLQVGAHYQAEDVEGVIDMLWHAATAELSDGDDDE